MSDSVTATSLETPTVTVQEKPQNGLAGLKHWRHDLPAGLLVSMISVPFSIGIAIASGAPPICGLTSAIIAGFVLPFLGGSFVTISGPAAGLAPALYAGMLTLGQGDLERGYPLLLVAICLTGAAQVFLSYIKAARFAAIFPAAVVEGMLAAIGMLIIVKQLPGLLGHPYEAHEFWGIVLETPREFMQMNPKVFVLGVSSLALIFLLGSFKTRWLKILPPPVIVVVLGTIAGQFLYLDKSDLIFIPENPLEHGLVLPDFQGVLTDKSLWLAVATIVLTLTMIDGVESLATIAAIDKVDPYKRKSDPNQTLLAMGVSNMCSSVVGGLTIIPGGVKSTANILGGGRTQWANFYNACFLLLFLFFGSHVMNLMPKSALAAVLIFIGYKLCKPSVWRHVAQIGKEQLLIFAFTVVVTLSTDLLWGIFAGIAMELLLTVWFAQRTRAAFRQQNGVSRIVPLEALNQAAQLFRNPVTERAAVNGDYHLFFGRQLVCFNALHVNRELAQVPADTKTIFLHITKDLTLIDHTSCESLFHFAEEHNRNGHARVEIVGLDRLQMRSEVETCMRLGYVDPETEQVEEMP
ncbi:MAG: SulP family inorganic anion transporter [Planctomycetaceae bacterium]